LQRLRRHSTLLVATRVEFRVLQGSSSVQISAPWGGHLPGTTTVPAATEVIAKASSSRSFDRSYPMPASGRQDVWSKRPGSIEAPSAKRNLVGAEARLPALSHKHSFKLKRYRALPQTGAPARSLAPARVSSSMDRPASADSWAVVDFVIRRWIRNAGVRPPAAPSAAAQCSSQCF
jgi:hypothetical protein